MNKENKLNRDDNCLNKVNNQMNIRTLNLLIAMRVIQNQLTKEIMSPLSEKHSWNVCRMYKRWWRTGLRKLQEKDKLIWLKKMYSDSFFSNEILTLICNIENIVYVWYIYVFIILRFYSGQIDHFAKDISKLSFKILLIHWELLISHEILNII